MREHQLIDAETDLDIYIDASDFHRIEEMRDMFAENYEFGLSICCWVSMLESLYVSMHV